MCKLFSFFYFLQSLRFSKSRFLKRQCIKEPERIEGSKHYKKVGWGEGMGSDGVAITTKKEYAHTAGKRRKKTAFCIVEFIFGCLH